MSAFKKILAGVTALFLMFASLPATAQEIGTPTMVVLDNSGSMTADDAGGQTRIDVAKQATTALIGDLRATTPLGLTYYGGNTGETAADHEQGCRDVTLVRGPELDDTESLQEAVDALEPRGFTPIGRALQDSAGELPDGGTIVLVSDGIANCTPPDVCEVAEDLAEAGVDLVINTIGLNVDEAARAELECIAGAAGGTYTDARDADSLTEALKRATTRQYVTYESHLDTIEGSLEEDQATMVPEDIESFSTNLPPSDEPENIISGGKSVYWRIPVSEGERINVSVNTVEDPTVLTFLPGLFGLRADLQSSSADIPGVHDLCTHRSTTDDSVLTVVGPQTASVISEVSGSDNCEDAEMILEVERKGEYRADSDLPVEITITRFGKVDDSTVGSSTEVVKDAGLPAAADEDEPVDTTPGIWFDDAAKLDAAGMKVTTDIVAGETHFYKVPVGYGQMLRGGIRAVSNQEEDTGENTIGDALHLNAYNSARAAVRLTKDKPSSRVSENFHEFSHFSPISYGNLEGTGQTGDTWLGGEQYLAVTYMPFSEDEDISADQQLSTLHYELVMDAAGEVVEGPEFVESASASTETSISTETTTAAQEDEDSSLFTKVAAGAGLVLIIGLIVAFLMRGRKRA